MKFTIAIFGRETNKHAACFEDFAFALRDALKKLGHECVGFDPSTHAPLGRLIAFGINNSSVDKTTREARYTLPEDAIIFNTEQLAAVDDPQRFMENYAAYRKHAVWDYSQANIKAMREKFGFERTVHCPIGYIETMTSIVNKPRHEQDVDVLFYGSVNTNDRRAKILDGLESAGMKVKKLYGIYGKERDAWIARSKVVLNMHYYEGGIFEIFRVSHLLANKKCVISEAGGCDAELEKFAENATGYAPYEDLVETCKAAVNSSWTRTLVEMRGFEAFKRIKLIDSVKAAIEAS